MCFHISSHNCERNVGFFLRMAHLLCCWQQLAEVVDVRACDNCVESNNERRQCERAGESNSISKLGCERSNGWIIDVALSNKELTNEALRSDLMLLRRWSQSLIIYIGLSKWLFLPLALIRSLFLFLRVLFFFYIIIIIIIFFLLNVLSLLLYFSYYIIQPPPLSLFFFFFSIIYYYYQNERYAALSTFISFCNSLQRALLVPLFLSAVGNIIKLDPFMLQLSFHPLRDYDDDYYAHHPFLILSLYLFPSSLSLYSQFNSIINFFFIFILFRFVYAFLRFFLW